MIFPWQNEQWQHVLNLKSQSRLPHALLLTGMAGTGKATFADAFSRALLCQNVKADQSFCHQHTTSNKNACHACRLVEGRAHPNVLWIEPEKEGQAIKVDAIRHLSEFVFQSSLQSGERIVIIQPADAMNISASNALLKTLEEPPKDALIVLVCDQSDRLPATILSRCQRVLFPRPATDASREWLQKQTAKAKDAVDIDLLLRLSQGAPLKALAFLKDDLFVERKKVLEALLRLTKHANEAVPLASKLQSLDLAVVLDFILIWLMDALLCHLKASDQVTNSDYLTELQNLSQQLSSQKAAELMEYIKQLRGKVIQGVHLNKQLLLEELLIRYTRLFNDRG